MKSNTEHLKDLLHKWHNTEMPADISEAIEFIDAIEDEQENLKEELSNAELDLENLQTPDDSIGLTSVFLGLDTLHYRLEQGNLKIASQLENWINNIKEQNCAGVLL